MPSDKNPGTEPHKASLEEFERSSDRRPAFILTRTEVKLLGIAGYRLYDGHSLPPNLEGLLKASANIGSVVGQFAFGYLADSLGRKAVYGKELILIILATILTITTPTGSISPNGSLVYLSIFRILLGVGVGGDYPMSASVASDRANIRKRGTLLAYIFSSQGWGSFVGSLVTIIVLLCYKHVMDVEGKTSKVDGAWRIIVGLSLIPAFATLYQRLTLPESTRYLATQKLQTDENTVEELKNYARATEGDHSSNNVGNQPTDEKPKFLHYFSEWRHAKLLIGTCACWFLLDVAFYGINLNQNVVLQQIGFDGSSGSSWQRLFKIATGNIIITALGFVPGYYAAILTIEILGRKWLQIQGFLMAALFLGILAGKFHTLSTAAFVCYPAEVFPTRFRAFAHGISAAAGKAGAIISALVFNQLSKDIGTPAVLWIFFACCVAGAFFTLLLPEVKGRDPDLILIEEMKEGRKSMST
ncbi:hypothetical protein PLEOSDRAFT_1074665 [Pleurotus ostreatus PC15]|uniref:Major facilitator superfamily (MFS) profile domain-containing protein n=1 Tax=Pleurotus ostreatus (strain PC15) TaxID=1137138 RepID=A0A067NQ80_PLEO1|nr:hypothetical protein PLEOSDRAFT_1074665 [Pleurotus ostreatus PC15]